ncbi:unnamed protein product [Penicillium discolor]
MHRLRDSLLSPSPKGFPEIGELDSVSHDRQDTRESLARGGSRGSPVQLNLDRQRQILQLWRRGELGEYIGEIWYMYFQLSLYTSHETPGHNRLVLDIIRIKGMGALTRPVKGIYGIDIARTTEGTRLNFASYLAKLASTCVCKDGMCQVAVVIFRCKFEQRQEIFPSEDKDEEDSHRSMGLLKLRHLLPAAHAWCKEASYNIIQLSEVSWNDCPSAVGQGDPWLLESELGKRSPIGFTPWRWMYWLKRLNEIEEEAKRAGEKRLEEYATETIHTMVTGVEERNSDILRGFKTAGDHIYEDKHFLPLKRIVEGEDPFYTGSEAGEGEDGKREEESQQAEENDNDN